jgi:hypothetical protein
VDKLGLNFLICATKKYKYEARLNSLPHTPDHWATTPQAFELLDRFVIHEISSVLPNILIRLQAFWNILRARSGGE